MRTTPQERIDDFHTRGWWGDETLVTLFDAVVAECPENLALVDPPNRGNLTGGQPQRLTFSELARRVDDIAALLHAGGVVGEDIVVIQMPNVAELVMLYLALGKLGAIVSPAAVQYGVHELGKIASDVEANAYITLSHFRGGNPAAANRAAFLETCTVFAFGDDVPEGVLPLDGVEPDANQRAAAAAHIAATPQCADDVFTICWTSGTTGQPKGVPRTHNMWLTSAWTSYDCVRFRKGDVFLNPFPLVNMASIGGFLYNWLLRRATLVLHHPLDLAVFLRQIEQEKVTYTIAAPAILTMLLKDPKLMAATDLSSVRVIGSGGAPLSPWMVREYQEKHEIVVINIFGSNEGMGLISGWDDMPDPAARAEYFPRFGVEGLRWNNRIAERMRTRLVDIDSGEEITEPGRPGELLIWGASVFDGYFNAPETNREVFTEDGFFHTGDLFEIAGEGPQPLFYRFIGRCKDIIVRGGMKISPDELDNLLAGHPKIAEVAVVGYADEVMEERVAAVVVPKSGEEISLDELTAYLEAERVAIFKWPERLFFIEKLPRNPVGKVPRGQLKDWVEKQLAG